MRHGRSSIDHYDYLGTATSENGSVLSLGEAILKSKVSSIRQENANLAFLEPAWPLAPRPATMTRDVFYFVNVNCAVGISMLCQVIVSNRAWKLYYRRNCGG
jgi:hypothetical protein